MAKRKHRLDPDPSDTATWQQEQPPAPPVDQEDDEIDQVFAAFPQNEPCLELFRIHPQGGRPLFLENVAPSLFSFAYVTQRYGGGRFSARGKYRDGSWVKLPFEIEGDAFPVKRVPPAENAAAPPVHPSMSPPVPSGFLDKIQVTGDNNQALVALMQTLIFEMRNSETQFLEKMMRYKELFAPAKPAETPLDTALMMFQKGAEMAGSVGGEGISPWLLALREFKEPLTKIVDTIQLAIKHPSRPAPVPGGPLPSLPSTGSSTPVDPRAAPDAHPSPDTHPLVAFRAILPLLINGATKNSDPALYAEIVLDQTPASQYSDFRQWLSLPGCLDQLAALEPGIRFQQEWWSGLRSALLETLSEELEHAIRPVHTRSNQDAPTEPATDHDEIS